MSVKKIESFVPSKSQSYVLMEQFLQANLLFFSRLGKLDVAELVEELAIDQFTAEEFLTKIRTRAFVDFFDPQPQLSKKQSKALLKEIKNELPEELSPAEFNALLPDLFVVD